ncbi:6-phosphogluconate dehydrogenase C-terminal domain-like protein [Xylariaceae sp. FL1019]|nr:6-phosphogluconate dehydrogenase C-terminal domain-like protein [Xylariaceae sp. FL1019]
MVSRDTHSASPGQVAPGWLQQVVDSKHQPSPTMYAWTPANLDPTSNPPTSPHMDKNDERRIYILGIGNGIGRLYAMCLSKLADRPPITLVVHKKELLEYWTRDPGIKLTRHGVVEKDKDFDIEWWTATRPDHGPVSELAAEDSCISNLIIATKASDAMPQVDRIRKYLTGRSTVAFAQNGMCKLWPPLGETFMRTRFGSEGPSWIACVTTHGVTSQGLFSSTHASPADVQVGPIRETYRKGGETCYLVQQMENAPGLAARQVSRKDIWVSQLEKLAVNVIINPLTGVLDCKNGELFLNHHGDALPIVIDALLLEASCILQALVRDETSEDILLPEPRTSAGATRDILRLSRDELLTRFSFSRLKTMLHDVGAKVAANTSSMLQDVRAGRQTEIDEMNGWLVGTAKVLGGALSTSTHEKLIALIKCRTKLSRKELCANLLGHPPS